MFGGKEYKSLGGTYLLLGAKTVGFLLNIGGNGVIKETVVGVVATGPNEVGGTRL